MSIITWDNASTGNERTLVDHNHRILEEALGKEVGLHSFAKDVDSPQSASLRKPPQAADTPSRWTPSNADGWSTCQ